MEFGTDHGYDEKFINAHEKEAEKAYLKQMLKKDETQNALKMNIDAVGDGFESNIYLTMYGAYKSKSWKVEDLPTPAPKFEGGDE